MPGIASIVIKKVSDASTSRANDSLAVEEPLEISLGYSGPNGITTRNISVTMRTPGNDAELAAGFLFTEGIIRDGADIESVVPGISGNTVVIHLRPGLVFDLQKLERNFYTTSSCGVCGKSSVDAVRSVSSFPAATSTWSVPSSLLYELPARLRKEQEIFESTGGLHASALFDAKGNLLLLREDVGRHNALDKLVGAALEKKLLPLRDHILLLSGRASFELIQKAAMAGIAFVAAVGAPSSLAVELAKESGMTLVGFLRDQRFNIYTGETRIFI